MPPTEKRGRVHTSLITVAVLPELDKSKLKIPEKDFKMDIERGKQSAGGQNANKCSNAVRIIHIPTGMMVRIDSKSQDQNKKDAWEILLARLQKLDNDKKHKQRDQDRQNQIGISDAKVRTVREKDGIVINNLNSNKISVKDYFRGNLSELI